MENGKNFGEDPVVPAAPRRFITRVNINAEPPQAPGNSEEFNFMHDPSTMIHYTPVTYANHSSNSGNNSTVRIEDCRPKPILSQFADICITTTKPSLPESQNLDLGRTSGADSRANSKELLDSGISSGPGSGDGLLIISGTKPPAPSADSADTRMHLLDVKNATKSPTGSPARTSATAGAPHSENSSPQSESPEPQHQFRRKVSLMPLVTEEELKNHPMGHKDPVSVAQVFGEDFASKFCVQPPLIGPSPMSAFSLFPPKSESDGNAGGSGGHSPLPYDSKEKMVVQRVSPEAALLPFEIRDKNLPTGVPTVKVRRKPMKLSLQHDINAIAPSQSAPLSSTLPLRNEVNGVICDPTTSVATAVAAAADDTYEVAVALSPVTPKFPSLPASAIAATTANYSPGAAGQRDAGGGFFNFDVADDDDIGAGNPDIVHFQQEINAWLKKQSNIIGSAFVLSSSEINSCYCEVFGPGYLEDPVNCGDSEYLRNLFDFPAANPRRSQATSEEMIRIQHRRQQLIDNPQLLLEEQGKPVVLDLRRIREEKPNVSVEGLRTILRLICNTVQPGCEDHSHGVDPPASSSSPPSASKPADGEEPDSSTSVSAPNHPEWEEGSDEDPANSIIAIHAKCGFVAGLVLVHRNEKKKKEDLEIVLPHISLMATLMSIIDNVEEQRRLARQTKKFLTMTQNVFSSLQDMNELVRNITREAKALVQAEICSLFLLDKEHSELVAEVFEKNGTSDEYLTEIRMPLTQGVVGHVATTGQMLNVRNVDESPYFYKKVDEMTGFNTRNILCFPIKDEKNHLVGVAELCNKIGKKSFTRQDEQCAATFSVYCALSISHCLLYRKLQEAHRRSHMAAELLVQGSTIAIAPEDILRLTVRDIPSPTSFHRQFDQFSFVPRCIGTGDTYVEASLSMFKALGFIDKYRLRRRTLARFLLMVQKGYRDVPYHNWSHAFAVGHFCYMLIKIPAVMEALSDLERFALLVACLCHDIDHRGTTNAFQLQSKTPLAQLYSSEGSVLERHHFAQTVTILGMEECNIFDQLTRAQYQTVLDHIREIILATDIAAHLRKVHDIQQMVNDGYNGELAEHRYLLTCLLMTASDLSDQSKDFQNSKSIAENIYKEFFSQGDLEKQMGNEPNEMMDRDRACVPQIQLHFMDTVALPVFKFAAQLLPELRSTYDSMEMNRVCWQELDKILREDGYASGGLDYLHDAELERRVYERLAQREGSGAIAAAAAAQGGRVRALVAPRCIPGAVGTSAAENRDREKEPGTSLSARSDDDSSSLLAPSTASTSTGPPSARTRRQQQPTTKPSKG